MAGERALVVDDTEGHREMVAFMLRRAGWEVEEAEGGAAAMEKVWGGVKEGRPFRLVVLDVMMPEMDGFTVAEKIRRVEREQPVGRSFIVGLTGYPDYLISDEARRRADFDRLVTKPTAHAQLAELFEEARCDGRA